MTGTGPGPSNSPGQAIGEKPFAYDIATKERVYANEAPTGMPHRVREGFCYRVDRDESSFFRFYSTEWHVANGYQPPSPGGERPAHEEAILWIFENKRFGVATEPGPFYAMLEDVRMEFWTGVRRPDLTATIVECWPRRYAKGTTIYIEVCLTHQVEDEKLADLRAEGIPTIEIYLDEALRKDGSAQVLADRDAFKRKIQREMVRCPRGAWLIP